MPPGHILLEFIPDPLFIPVKQAEKLLQVAGGLAERIRDGFEALARQRAQLSLDIQVEIPPGGDPPEVAIKLVQKLSQLRFDLQNHTGIHTDDLLIRVPFSGDHRMAT